jgi:hypothetical protein
MSIGSISLQGIQNAESLLNTTAARIANPTPSTEQGADTVSLSDNIVALIQAKNEMGANVKALQVTDDMQKSLLDVVG